MKLWGTNLWVDALVLLLLLAGIAVYSSAETALYRVSRVRVDMEARQRSRLARLVRSLLSNETRLVILLVIGLNVCLELMTHDVEELLLAAGTPHFGIELWLTVLVTPFVFFFGELLPKELARRRPHAWLAIGAPVVALSRWLFWPIERVLYLVTALVSRVFNLPPRLFLSGQGRDAVLEFLREGRRHGAIPHSAEQMARNVLELRTIPVERCMVPWKSVTRLDARDADPDLYAAVSRSPHTRLVVVAPDGTISGYVHQLDVLGAGPGEPVLVHLREILRLPPGTPVDRALARLRAAGQRIAIVGDEKLPVGLVTLKDLVEEISGDLSGW
jgi:CBS domain containing-hemolysin-like protein